MTYEMLAIETANAGVEIVNMNFKGSLKGLYGDNVIAIDSKIETDIERKCILIEELGHHYKTVGNITDQNKIENRKQELIARRWGYEKLIGIIDLVNAYRSGVRNRYELAEYLGVTEQFLEEALEYYKCKYETGLEIDNYWITFDNGLNILEKFY